MEMKKFYLCMFYNYEANVFELIVMDEPIAGDYVLFTFDAPSLDSARDMFTYLS